MKIRLRNFRCYTDATFEFESKGLLLLSGDSGNGKTTILEAVVFALYDAVKRPYSFGMKSKDRCFVELTLEQIYVYRSRRPNIVKVTTSERSYEHTEAQAVINATFGTFHEFIASSYVKQGLHSSILTLTPTEQLKFVEKLAYAGRGHERITESIKETSKRSEHALIEAQTEHRITTEQYNNLKEEHTFDEPLSKPEKTLEEIREEKEQANSRTKENKKAKQELQKYIEKAHTIEDEMSKLVDKERSLKFEISQLEQRVSLRSSLMTVVERANLEASTEDMKKRLDLHERTLKYDEARKAYEDAKTEYDAAYNDKLKDLKEIVGNDSTKIQKVKEEITKLEKIEKEVTTSSDRVKRANESLQQTIADIEKNLSIKYKKVPAKIKALERKLNTTKSKLDVLKIRYEKNLADIVKTKVYTCPSCQACLIIGENDEMIESKEAHSCNKDNSRLANETKIEIEKTEASIRQIETYKERLVSAYTSITQEQVPEFDSLKLEELRSSYERLKTAAEELVRLKASTPTKTLLRLKKTMESLVVTEEFEPIDATIRDTISKNYRRLEEEWKLSGEINLASRELSEKKASILAISKTIIQLRTSNNLSEPIDVLLKKYTSLQSEDEAIQTYLNELNEETERWLNYIEYEKFKKTEAAVKISLEKLAIAENNVRSILTIKNLSHTAEILALDSIIATINEHVRYYIDMMFPDGAMTVRLENVKRTRKDTKCGMNVYIEYKGSQYSDVYQLSGGERDRVNLCFVLAINSMLNSNILMLDESLASLDSDTNTEIFTMLREIASSKCVLIVSHEATRGIFDNIYNI